MSVCETKKQNFIPLLTFDLSFCSRLFLTIKENHYYFNIVTFGASVALAQRIRQLSCKEKKCDPGPLL